MGEEDKFLETYNLPTLNQEEAESLTRLVMTSEIEAIIKILPAHKHPELYDFTGKLYQTFKEDLIYILLKLFQKIQESGRLHNAFYKASIILIQNQVKI